MIAGTILIEDTTITFQMVDGLIQFTASDCHTGKQYGMLVDPNAFAAALGVALHPDPDTLPAEMWSAAETVQEPKEGGLRWIP